MCQRFFSILGLFFSFLLFAAGSIAAHANSDVQQLASRYEQCVAREAAHSKDQALVKKQCSGVLQDLLNALPADARSRVKRDAERGAEKLVKEAS